MNLSVVLVKTKMSFSNSIAISVIKKTKTHISNCTNTKKKKTKLMEDYSSQN